MGLTNAQQAILVAATFVLVSIQGFLQASPFVADHEALQILILLIPAVIYGLKELAGATPQPGLLTDRQQSALMTIAVTLVTIGATLSAQTTNPLYLFVLGLVAAIVAGLKEFLGAVASTPVPVPP